MVREGRVLNGNSTHILTANTTVHEQQTVDPCYVNILHVRAVGRSVPSLANQKSNVMRVHVSGRQRPSHVKHEDCSVRSEHGPSSTCAKQRAG